MPKRSNAFQQVVMLLHKQFKGDSIVTESKELLDSSTGGLREVDIVIECKVSNYPVVISIECTDSSRPVSVEWVERMIGKHANLQTNQLVLVSRSGFTKQAKIKAETNNHIAVSLKEAEDIYWPNKITIWTLIAKYEVFLKVKLFNSIKLFAVPRDTELYDKNKKHILTVDREIEKIISKRDIGKAALNIIEKELNTEAHCCPIVPKAAPVVAKPLFVAV